MLKVGIFNVRVVMPGDMYGKDFCLTNNGDPLVEFYDATQDPDKFGTLGQFVSRYYITTLMCPDIRGLNLYGGVPLWQVSEDQMGRVKAYLVGFFDGMAK